MNRQKEEILLYISKLNLFHTSNSLVSFTYVVFYLLTIKMCSFFSLWCIVLPYIADQSIGQPKTHRYEYLYVLNFIQWPHEGFFQ